MMKSVLNYIFPLFLFLVSCAKETDPVTDPIPLEKTVHYRVAVEAGSDTRASVDENLKYVFEAGDRVYMQSEGGEMYGFLSLSQESDAGKTLAFFEGDLTCADDFSPVRDTPVSLVLVGPDDKIHAFSDEGKLTDIAYTDYQVSSLKEAVRCLSHFTSSGKFGDLRFTLSQQASFVVFNFLFDEETVNAGDTYTATFYNASDNLFIYEFKTQEAEDGSIEASWVSAFEGGTELSGAKVLVQQEGREDVRLNMSDKTLAANSYYTFQRSTFMQDYLTVETTQDNTKVTFNKASGNSIQYSLDGYDWKNYTAAVTLPNVGDKIYFRGKGTTYQQTGNDGILKADKACYVYGDLMFLMCNDKYKAKKVIEAEFAFQRAFYKASWLRLSEDPKETLKLSATTLSTGCYFEMFRECTGLTSLDRLDFPKADVTLSDRCFDSMFLGTGITAIPEGFLPWTTLQMGCYRRMFYECKNLVTVPSGLLPATTLAPHCYMNMFFNCYALTDAPDLPATTPEPGCYFAMFRHCHALGSVKCLIVLTTEQMSGTDNPQKSVYDDAAAPSPNNLSQWTVVSAWTVFNKWLQDVPNDNARIFTKNSAMTFPRNDGIGGIPNQWNVVDN